jgi:hypothetical protein
MDPADRLFLVCLTRLAHCHCDTDETLPVPLFASDRGLLDCAKMRRNAQPKQLVACLLDEMTDQTRVDSQAKLNPDARPIDAHHQPARAERKPATLF